MFADRAAHRGARPCWCRTRRSARRSALLWDAARLVAEPGGATALAALLSGAWAPPPGARVGVLVCGGNCDPGSVAG